MTRTCVIGKHEIPEDEKPFELTWDGSTWGIRAYTYGFICADHALQRADLLNGPGFPLPEVKEQIQIVKGIEVDGVFVPFSLLGELAEQGEYDSQFGDAFLIHDKKMAQVLEASGLAIHETRGGYHRGPFLEKMLEELDRG